QTVVRRVSRSMAVHAEPHVQVDDAFGDRLLADVAVAGGAFDVGAHVRRMAEPHVGFGRVPVDSLPRDVHAPFLMVGQLLNDRTIGGNSVVAVNAGIDAWQSGNRILVR